MILKFLGHFLLGMGQAKNESKFSLHSFLLWLVLFRIFFFLFFLGGGGGLGFRDFFSAVHSVELINLT